MTIAMVSYYLSSWTADAIPPEFCDVVTNSSSSSPEINVTSVSIIPGASDSMLRNTDRESGFDPPVIMVTINTTVTWINNDEDSHSVTSGHPYTEDAGQLFDSGLIHANRSFQHTFETHGEFNYFDHSNKCNWGSVIVEQQVTETTRGGEYMNATDSSAANATLGSDNQ
jgi:plastocyanin